MEFLASSHPIAPRKPVKSSTKPKRPKKTIKTVRIVESLKTLIYPSDPNKLIISGLNLKPKHLLTLNRHIRITHRLIKKNRTIAQTTNFQRT